jgi:hypothetical protein
MLSRDEEQFLINIQMRLTKAAMRVASSAERLDQSADRLRDTAHRRAISVNAALTCRAMPKHPIMSPETFSGRKLVLESMSALKGRWKVVDGGSALEVDLPLNSYSTKERAIIEFALNPQVTAENIFAGLDRNVQKKLAAALQQIYG